MSLLIKLSCSSRFSSPCSAKNFFAVARFSRYEGFESKQPTKHSVRDSKNKIFFILIRFWFPKCTNFNKEWQIATNKRV